MTVERNEDGSISIKSKNGATVIGKIIGASDDNSEAKYKKWIEECATVVTPCAHTLQETEQYFLNLCDAEPISQDNWRIKGFKVNIIMNYFKDRLQNQTSKFSFDMTDEEIEKWHKKDRAMHDEAMNVIPEQFGLKIRGYYLPHSKTNEVFYNQAYKEAEERMGTKRFEEVERNDIYVFFEETTEHWQCDSGSRSLANDLIVFRGVSEEDIKERNPRFLGYISALRELG